MTAFDKHVNVRGLVSVSMQRCHSSSFVMLMSLISSGIRLEFVNTVLTPKSCFRGLARPDIKSIGIGTAKEIQTDRAVKKHDTLSMVYKEQDHFSTSLVP